MIWTKEQLIERANLWAIPKGYSVLTEGTFLQWRKDGLLSGPKPRGRGRGSGKAEDWGSVTYLHLLKVMRLRHQGISNRRQQRILLWMAGQKIEEEKVRSDFIQRYTANMKQIDRFVGMNRLAPKREAMGVVPNKIKLLGKEMLGDIQNLFRLCDDDSPEFIRFLRPLILAKADELSRVTVMFSASLFSPEYEPFNDWVKNVAGLLSKSDGLPQDGLIKDLSAGSGLFSNPDECENNVLKALESFPIESIRGIRDLVNLIPLFCSNLLLALSLLVEQGEFGTSRFPLISAAVVKALRKAASKPLILSNDTKVSLFYILLHVSQSYGHPNMFKTFAEIRIDALVLWAIENSRMLTNRGDDIKFVQELIRLSDLPEPARKFAEKCLSHSDMHTSDLA